MFESTGLWALIECPDGDRCAVLNCIFRHQETCDAALVPPPVQSKSVPSVGFSSPDEPPRKKQRIAAGAPPQKTAGSVPGTVPNASAKAPAIKPTSTPKASAQPRNENFSPPLRSTHKRISPPPTKNQTAVSKPRNAAIPSNSAAANGQTAREESLNPRLVPKPPAAHALRMRLLGLIHAQFRRLNGETEAAEEDATSKLKMTPQELVKAALDEEERTAKFKPSVYPNVMKLRILALQKMKLPAWCEERVKALEKQEPGKKKLNPVQIETDLTAEEELALLPGLVTSQNGLDKHGYVTSQISEADIEKAREGLSSAHGYEVCDRCGTRFQAFPGRREDGVLTTGGSCTYHFGRLQRRSAGGGSDITRRYTCCQDEAGSKGCEVAQTHVFKVSDPKRLASVLAFMETPTVGPRIAKSAVCFDCEMGYTTRGMELIRLTATEWPSGKEALDVLVRPVGEILDLNSRFSGVWPEGYTKAVPYNQELPPDGNEATTDGKLRIVGSPAVARELLFRHLTTTTPLIGHALENDLNAARILHPTIIDTVLLFPHQRGLPIRNGLKALAKEHLHRDIQMAGAQGHDSKEDARAAGELVRFKVAKKWQAMKRDGWTVKDGEFNPPKPP